MPKLNTGIRPNNLIRIKKNSHRSDTNIIIGTCNTQSIKNKDLQVSDLLEDYGMDALIVTETWLTSKEMDRPMDGTDTTKQRTIPTTYTK